MAIIFICFGFALTRGTRRKSTAKVMDFKAKQFSYLNITVITSVFVPDGIDCGFACLTSTSCFSYNLAAFPDVNGKLLCELLPSDKYNNTDKFIASPIFHHFSIWSPCFRNPCKNNATCVANYVDDDYQCACSPGHMGEHCEGFGKNCKGIKRQDESAVDGTYLLDPDGGSHSNAFQAYCDMTSYDGGWTMCYTTDDYVKPKTQVTYNTQFPYGSDGYRTDCNNIPFTEVLFVDHQTGNKTYFKRQTKQPIMAANIFGNAAATGLWDGVGTNTNFNYQLLVCDHSFYSGFFVSGLTGNCYKQCNSWCGDTSSPYFRTASTSSPYNGVAFNTNGHSPNRVSNRLISVGLR